VLMPLGRTAGDREARLCRTAAALLILLTALARFCYLLHDCPLDLAPDEAHYWDWSRHLDWSYYSKGPLVAWLIRASCELLGGWSQVMIGNEMLAVRAPAVLCGSLLLLGLYVLTLQVYRSDRQALAVMLIALTMPVIAAGSSLMTIDAPYCCCWCWALVLAHRAIFCGSRWAWSAAGVVVLLGVLAKYNMVLFVPSVGLFLLTDRERRVQLVRPGFWVMTFLGALGGVPILCWNVANGWVTFQHVEHLAGMSEGSRIHWLGPLSYLGGQFALLLGFWFAVWAAAMVAHRPWREADAGKRYLWWTSLPMFAVFLGFSLKTGGGELNWPVTAYLSGLVLAVGWLAEQLNSPSHAWRRIQWVGLGTAAVLGVALTLTVHMTEWVRPVLLAISGPPSPRHPMPLRRFDPSCRLRGWRTLAAEVDRLRAELRGEGVEAVVAATSWALPGEVGFYCAGHPDVYDVGLVQGDRHSQYDLWRPNPVGDPQQFRGKTFIIVNAAPAVLAGFAKTDAIREVIYFEDGHPIARWVLHVCRDFRGFPRSQSNPSTF